MTRDDRSRGAALATALLLGVPAVDLLVGGTPAAVHGVLAACGIAFFIVWLREL
jgi:hypothetical protein